ncbi:MAG TPA: hypothetical protein VJ726_12195 [Candidatus Limnocylindria bacterium]|nr:hypothetical protein [Candidatus Limnocylindria bacterium]
MLVIAPYAVSVPLAFVVGERLEAATASGLIALALAPGALVAPALVAAAGGRRSDMAGALLLGTAILSFVLVVTRPSASTVALTAAQAFAVASIGAGALPQVRDRILGPLRWAGYLAALVVFLLAIAAGPPIDAVNVIVALAGTLVTLAVAGVVAIALRRDVLSAAAAAGTRDPIVAIALAWATGGSEATAVPIVSAAILGILAAALVLRRR